MILLKSECKYLLIYIISDLPNFEINDAMKDVQNDPIMTPNFEELQSENPNEALENVCTICNSNIQNPSNLVQHLMEHTNGNNNIY